jgi:Ca2+-binding EF-hand superfamily protein
MDQEFFQVFGEFVIELGQRKDFSQDDRQRLLDIVKSKLSESIKELDGTQNTEQNSVHAAAAAVAAAATSSSNSSSTLGVPNVSSDHHGSVRTNDGVFGQGGSALEILQQHSPRQQQSQTPPASTVQEESSTGIDAGLTQNSGSPAKSNVSTPQSRTSPPTLAWIDNNTDEKEPSSPGPNSLSTSQEMPAAGRVTSGGDNRARLALPHIDPQQAEAEADLLKSFEQRTTSIPRTPTNDSTTNKRSDKSKNARFSARPDDNHTMISHLSPTHPPMQVSDATAGLEHMLVTKMDQLGLRRQFFSKYDKQQTGYIHINAFQSALASLGIRMTETEASHMLLEYDDTNHQAINYVKLLRALEQRRHLHNSAANIAYTSAAVTRDAVNPRDIDRFMGDVETSLPVRLQQGMRWLRERVYAQQTSLRTLFMRLDDNGDGNVDEQEIMSSLFQLGLPSHLISQDELRTYVRQHCADPTQGFRYSDFITLVNGSSSDELQMMELEQRTGRGPIVRRPDVDEMRRKSVWQTNVTAIPELAQAKYKLGGDSLRQSFLQLDVNRDGAIDADEILNGLRMMGLSETLSDDPDGKLRAHIESFAQTSPGELTFAEFVRFVKGDTALEFQRVAQEQIDNPQARQLKLAYPYVNEVIPPHANANHALTLIRNKVFGKRQMLREAFNAYDPQQSGMIDQQSLQFVLADLRFTVSDETAAQIFQAFQDASLPLMHYYDFIGTVQRRVESALHVQDTHKSGRARQFSLDMTQSARKPDHITNFSWAADHEAEHAAVTAHQQLRTCVRLVPEADGARAYPVLDPEALPEEKFSALPAGLYKHSDHEMLVPEQLPDNASWMQAHGRKVTKEKTYNEMLECANRYDASHHGSAARERSSQVIRENAPDTNPFDDGPSGRAELVDAAFPKKPASTANIGSASPKARSADRPIRSTARGTARVPDHDIFANDDSPNSTPARRRPSIARHRQHSPSVQSDAPFQTDTSADQPSEVINGIDIKLLKSISEAVYATSTRLLQVFRNMAVTDRKHMNKKDMWNGMKQLGFSLTASQVNALFAQYSSADDETMSYSDFVRMLSAAPQ